MLVSRKVKDQYKGICKNSWQKCLGDESLLAQKIIRSVELGRVTVGNEDGLHIVRYTNLDFVLNGSKIVQMYINNNDPVVKVSEEVKNHYNEVHSIEQPEPTLNQQIMWKLNKIKKLQRNRDIADNKLERLYYELDELRSQDDIQKRFELYA